MWQYEVMCPIKRAFYASFQPVLRFVLFFAAFPLTLELQIAQDVEKFAIKAGKYPHRKIRNE